MKAIFKRELKAYFTSMIGYAFLAMFLVLIGVLFYFNNIYFGIASVKNFFSLLTTWMIFVMPILTMRLFAEDRKLKIDQLLLSTPISVKSIVLGKFFAAFSVFMIAMVISFIYVVIISFFGTINWAETISCYIGFILLCSTVISIGAFLSSITESQILSAVISYFVLIPTIFMEKMAAAVSGVFKSIFMWLSISERYLDFAMGILDPSALVYYLSLTLLFLFLTVNVTERRRFR